MNSRKLKKLINNIVIVSLLLAGLAYVLSRVRRHITPVNTRVQGFIRKIYFEEYRPVKAGDTLLVIEDAEFRLRLAQARADLANASAGRAAAAVSVATMQNNLSVSDAAIEEVRVRMENCAKELARYEVLLGQEAVTRQQYDNVKTAYDEARARYDQLQRSRQSTTLGRDEQSHRLEQNEAMLRLAEAAVELAELNLSYTVILAPCDGVAGSKDIHEGQLVQPGQTMLEIVDGGGLWVIANYRETQLRHITEGAQVSITADAVPGVVYSGVVEAVSDATGAAFSILPQDNATGNFVKVEQRVPVRISLEGNSPDQLSLLRAGFNVECRVKY